MSGRSSRGGAPGIDAISPICAPRGRASPRTGAACTDAAARGTGRRRGPLSTISPAYMTAARVQSCATTGRSCVTRISASPKSRQSAVEQLEDLRLHHHVQRGRRLVRDQDLRVAGERHRDRRPLAHAAGQLVRESAPPGSPGSRPTRADRALCARAAEPRRASVQLERLDDLRADRPHRVEGVHRALEDDRDVHPAVRADALLAVAPGDPFPRGAPCPDTLAVRRQQPEDRERGRRLPAARLADEAEPFARREGQLTPCTACSSPAPSSMSNQTWRSSIWRSGVTAPPGSGRRAGAAGTCARRGARRAGAG